ncbi:Hypothetical protein GbCGDNIH6_8044 [Granulibacter bethesdensis]|nr:Hypothetical protein GbCGDNIH6_8044 [Granulibacter bethesdensis]
MINCLALRKLKENIFINNDLPTTWFLTAFPCIPVAIRHVCDAGLLRNRCFLWLLPPVGW